MTPRFILPLALPFAALILPVLAQDKMKDPEPGSFEAVAQEATLAYHEEDWVRAIDLYRRAGALGLDLLKQEDADPQVRLTAPIMYYNAACSAALAGRVDDAFTMLNEAFDAGFLDQNQIARDTDLDPLRADATRWTAAMEHLEKARDVAEVGFRPVETWIPEHEAGDRLPVLTVLSGGGGNAQESLAAWKPWAERNDTALITIRGSRLAVPSMYMWTLGDWKSEVARIDDCVSTTLATTPVLDPDRVRLAGWSQGGGMALVMATQSTREWNGVIVVGPALPQGLEEVVGTEFPQCGGAIACVVGGEEEAAAVEQQRRLFAAGQDGARRRLTVIEGIGHNFTPETWKQVDASMEWLDEERSAAEE